MQRVSINGVHAEYVSVKDRALHYGDGIFETISCNDNKLHFWNDHIERMRDGAKTLDIEAPPGAVLLNDIKTLINNAQGRYVVKILLTRGAGYSEGDRGYKVPVRKNPTRIVMVGNWPDYPDDMNEARLCLCKSPVSINPRLSGIKHLNRLDNVLARNEWKDEYHEGLMSDINGNIIEGTMSNVFAIKNKELFTPSLDLCGISGVVRKQIIDIANDMSMPLHITNMSKDDMFSMDEIFITNSIIGIWPVGYIGDKKIKMGDITDIFIDKLLIRSGENEKPIS